MLSSLFSFAIQGCKTPIEPGKETAADTTSHNFSWQMFEYGDFYGTGHWSMIHDVAIVSSNDIWAVGEIYLKDTTGKNLGTNRCNAMHWDGVKWKLFKFQFRTFPEQPDTNAYICSSVCVLDSGKVIISSGEQVTFIKNEKQLKTEYIPVWVRKIWAGGSNDIYAVGSEGKIAHYDGKSWRKVESGTTMTLIDLFSNNGRDIYAVGGRFPDYDGVLLKGNADGFSVIAEGKASVKEEELFKPYFLGTGSMLWVSPSDTVYFGGGLFYAYKKGEMSLVSTLNGNKWGLNNDGHYWGYLSGIRGNADNDIALVGEGNTIRHYNGKSWRQLGMPYDYNSEYTWVSVDMKGNTIAAVGRSNSKGIIMILKRGE